MQVDYVKANESDPAVITLATAMKVPAKEVVAIINQQRYRAAYNKLQQSRMKVARRIMREHPELVKEVQS